jgi:hypothetical protein
MVIGCVLLGCSQFRPSKLRRNIAVKPSGACFSRYLMSVVIENRMASPPRIVGSQVMDAV